MTRHIKEADLVHAQEQGLALDEDAVPQREPKAEVCVIRDPASVHIVGLLKALPSWDARPAVAKLCPTSP